MSLGLKNANPLAFLDGKGEMAERFHALLKATSDIIYRMSPDWSELLFLRGGTFLSDTLKPTRAWVDKYVYSEDKQLVQETVQRAILYQEIFELEHRVIRADGSIGWSYSRAVPVMGNNNEIVEWLGSASDVTPRKEAEYALMEASRQKDEFLATLAHELRNPLVPLSNGLQMLRFTPNNPQSLEKIRAMMERQLNHMVRLVDDLLDLSRISCGKIVLQKEIIELGVIMEQAIESNLPLFNQAGQELIINSPSLPLFVEADITRLTQVFANLLNNASKYTGKGGKIRINISQHLHQAVVSIQDDGIGIPESMLPQVFNMFAQVDKHLERAQGGLGIGLSVVKKLVELHQGSIEVHSAGEHLGSEFIVRLPTTRHTSINPKPQIVTRPIPSRRILVVDDKKDVADSLAMLLEQMGNQTHIAYDGFSALTVAELFKPQLIFMDIGMPGLDGHETAKEIRRRAWGEEMILVALTGWGQDADRKRSRAAGFNYHITKPVQIHKLELILANELSATAYH